MAPAHEENPYEGGGDGGFGKFRKRPFRKTQTTPYDRPPTALRNPNRNNGWFSKLVDPAQRLIASSAHKLFGSLFLKRLPAPPGPAARPPTPQVVQELREHHQETALTVGNEYSGKQKGVVGETIIQSSDGDGLTELEKLLKQKTFTRSEIEHLTELMRSRTVGSSVEEERKSTEVIPSDPILPRGQREEYPKTPAVENVMDLVSTPFVAKVTSTVSVDDVASPAELAKAYMGSRSSKLSPLMLGLQSSAREDPTLLRSQNFAQKSPIMSIVPRATTLTRVHENGFVTPRSHGRSAIYNMARTPYSRVRPGSVPKGTSVAVEGVPSSSTQHVTDHHMLSGSKQGLLKRRSSVLDNDIGSFGPIRRIRHKSNLLSSNRLTSSHLGNPLSTDRSVVGTDAAQQPSSSMQKPNLLGEARHTHSKLSAETVDDTMPGTSIPPLPSKSSEMASKILQQLDKLVSPKEKSPTKLSSSMLRGQALRSMETVDSSKFLDNIRGNQLDDTLKNMSAGAPRLKSKIDETENGSSILVAPTDATVDANATVPRKQDISILKSGDSSGKKAGYHPPQKKRAFHMSAPEDYLELDDDASPNGAVSPFSTSGKETSVSTALADKTASSIEPTVLEKPPGSSVLVPSKIFTVDGKPHVRTADGSTVEEKVDVSSYITSSVSDPIVKPTTGATTVASNTSLGSNKSTTPNGSVANSPMFNFGNKVVPSTELAAAVAPSKDSTKPSPLFGLEKDVSSKEPGTEAPLVNSGFNKIVDKVPQVPFTFSSSGGESTVFKFGSSSDSKPKSLISSSPVDSMPKLELENAGAKSNNIFTGFTAKSSEPAVSSALMPSSTNIFTFGNSSNLNVGSAASSPSPFSPVVTNNLTDQNIFSSSSLAASNSSSSATVTSTSPGTTSSTPAIVAVTNNSSSSQVSSLSPITSVFKFGSTPLPSTSLPVSSSGSEPLENKNSIFGSSAAAVGITGSGIIGFNSSVATTGSSQSLGSVMGTTSGSIPGSLGSSFTSVFATSSESQSVAFSSSASAPLFGLTGSTDFASGSSLFSSSSATDIFKAGTTSGQITPAASEANAVSSSSGTSSTVFGLSSWPPNKSLFGSSFSSTSSPSSGFSFGSSFSSSSSSTPGFSFGSSTPSIASTSSPMMFGSSAVASTPQFSFTSATATTNTQPAFGSSSPVFSFGSAPVNNDQMNMEDSMAEDTVQATPPANQPATPVFGQQPAPLQSNFAFGASTPTGATPFQFGSQQNITPQNPSPFQASGSLEFNAGGSFSLGTGGGDKSNRKYVKVKHRPQRKK
ncbi:nuclear pore complex protein NUP1 isoform X2 [Vigna radiata var. radiata]|uniref:Nuclear pore complex protein NUP1 isoform X2 n=1 Tax=Vigna radiata var. radiata TaxID=3916 RepID=A0A3Q0F9R2_VIGRR|nr:nuclear pore complex protein NUP1 isoform X2 [Vigna radiata var. radiata]